MRFSSERVLRLALNAALMASLFAGCAEEPIDPAQNESDGRGLVFTASYDPEDAATRTQLDESGNHVLWSVGDKISIFDSDEIGYEFTASGSGSSASFTLTDSDSPSETDYWYALYPYNEDSDLSGGVITTTLNDEYTVDRAGSFNDEMNISVAKSSSKSLSFRNVLSWLKVASDGLGDDVVKIEMRGNNGEIMAGQIKIDYTGSTPVAALVEGTESKVMTINVENYVTSVNQPSANRVFFYIPVLPQTFEKGFTLTFYSESGETGGFVYDNEVSFVRNTRSGMFADISPLDDLKIVFADANFEAYCLENFDTNQDSVLTRGEAAEITDIFVCTDEIESIQEIEYMPALRSLNCWGNLNFSESGATPNGKLSSIDVSNNTELTSLCCYNNQLASLDVSQNTALSTLWCFGNQLTTLDVSNNSELTELDCSTNQLTSLNVSTIPALKLLLCHENLLTSLDVSGNTALNTLTCSNNQLTSLDVSNNSALAQLSCSPMNDSSGDNLLATLYIAQGQEIPNVTTNRNDFYIPDETEIVITGGSGGGEPAGEGGEPPGGGGDTPGGGGE